MSYVENPLPARKLPLAVTARSRNGSRSVLAREDGAFDLPSILVGVVTVGILTAGVLASIFGVIPYAQNKGAQEDAAAVNTAEGVAKAKDGKFMDTAGLIAAGYLSIPSASAAEAPADSGGFVRAASTTPALKYAVATDPSGTCFLVVAHSDSGSLYYLSDTAPKPQVLGATDTPPCVSETVLRTLIDTAGGDSSQRGPAKPVVTADPLTGYTAHFTWDAVAGATSYRVETSINGGPWTQNQTYYPEFFQSIGQGDTLDVRVITLAGSSESAPSAVVTVHKPGWVSALSNSGFENGTTGWTITGGGATAKTVPWISGEGNLLIQNGTPGFTVSQTAAVLPGQQVSVTMKIQAPVPANGALRFYDADHNEIAGSAVTWTGTQPDFPAAYLFASGTAAPAGAAFASVSLTTGDTSSFTAVDELSLNVFK